MLKKTCIISKLITNCKRKPGGRGYDGRKKFCKSVFHRLLKLKIRHHYLRITDEGLSKAEGFIKKMRNS